MRALSLAASLLVSTVGFAQVDAAVHTDPSRGATLMPDSVAWASQATALSLNPAGLNKVGTFELIWAHERSVPRDQVIDGLFFATSPFDALGLGLSIEWLRNTTDAARKTSAGLAFGGETLSIGAALNFYTGRDIDGLTSVDLGVQTRPGRYFSAGLTVKNVDAPGRGSVAFPRKWDLGVGIRPLKERLNVGIDWIFSDQTGLDASRMAYTLKGEVWKGVWLSGGFSHGFRTGDGLFFSVGATLDTAHFGAGYALGGGALGFNHLVNARLSADDYRPVPIAANKIAVVALNDVGETDNGGTLATLLDVAAPDKYLKLVRTLEGGLRDPYLKGVVIKVETSGLGLGRALELRELVVRLRAAGKFVIALILSASDPEYLIASAADRIYAVPEAMVMVDGLRSSVIFLGGTAQKLGVTIDVAKVGAYKNSPDQFTRSSMSPEQKEAIDGLLDTGVRAFDGVVPASRGITVDQWHAAVDEGMKSVKRAKELKLIDDVVTAGQLEEQLPDLIPGARLVADYDPNEEKSVRWGTPAHVAVIPVIGTISGGGGGSDPVGLTHNAGADPFLRALDAASRDNDVAAIVLRIDSPGGDGLASDMMYRAVLEAKRRKPVVASMGDVAASGGYYVAMGADEIFASPTTITGSIGVFYLKPAVKGLGESLGAHQESVTRGKLAGALDMWEPWTEGQRASVQKWIDDFYETFTTEAALSRKTTREAIDLVARGRVWSGEDAKAKGLVDTMGGLEDAIRGARQRAGYDRELPVVVYGPSGSMLSSVMGSSAVAKKLQQIKIGAASPLSSPVKHLARQLGADLLVGTGVQARLEYQLDVR